MTQIKIDVRDAQAHLLRAFKGLNKNEVYLSIARSINSALMKTQTASVRAITSRYNLTYGQVSDKFRVVRSSPATASSILRGYLKVYNNPFSLSAFNPKEISDGMATLTKRGRISGGRKAIGLRANKKLIKSGVIVEVIRGEQKVLQGAYIAIRNKANNSSFSVSARGKYEGGRGFNFKEDGASKSLRGIGVLSAFRSNEIMPIIKEYAENEYLLILSRELRKRVQGVGGQHSKHL